MKNSETRLSIKDISWLILIVTLGLILNSCQSKKLPQSFTIEPAITQFHSASNVTLATETSDVTETLSTSHPDSPVPNDQTRIPTPTNTTMQAVPVPPVIGSTRVYEVDHMAQVYIPAGEFTMGSDDIDAMVSIEDGRAYPEIPVHTVSVEGYWIDKFEITNSQYELCVNAGACESPYLNSSETRKDYFRNPEYANYPVIWVSWYMARTYCKWAGRRLPTEAEWEKAARGTDGRKYPWGNEPITGERANFCDINCTRDIANPIYDDDYADTAPVGNYPAGASPYGVMDMSGNVWEWNSTLIQPYPYDANDGREDLDVYGERVWRGGPWSNGYWWMRSSVRYRSIPTYWYLNLGFRCASSE